MNKLISILFCILSAQSCIAQSNCTNPVLINTNWIVSSIQDKRIVLDKTRKILDEKGAYIPDAKEIQLLLQADNKLEISYVSYDGLYENINIAEGTWGCKEKKSRLTFKEKGLHLKTSEGMKQYHSFYIEKIDKDTLVLSIID